MNEYEQLRLKNLEDNRKILAEIGLINPYKKLPKFSLKKGVRGNKRKAEDSISRPVKKVVELDPETSGSLRGSRRRSARIQGKDVPTDSELKEEVDQWNDENEAPTPKIQPNRPNFYGAVPGVEVGTIWATRMECCRDGVHRPTVAGIHAGADGAYSIALSGGYEDNIDLGDCFTYTGEGGRDLKGTASNPKNLRTAPQSKDQQLTRGNLALSRNVETGNPVRVIRGYKLQEFSPFAPEEGYRYDGLYTVEKFWSTYGASGFLVWKFALRRCSDQPPPPWTFDEVEGVNNNIEGRSDSGFDSDEAASVISSSQSSAASDDTKRSSSENNIKSSNDDRVPKEESTSSQETDMKKSEDSEPAKEESSFSQETGMKKSEDSVPAQEKSTSSNDMEAMKDEQNISNDDKLKIGPEETADGKKEATEMTQYPDQGRPSEHMDINEDKQDSMEK